VHYSTDYVFDGAKNTPYVEADMPNPINAYGRTKLAGEIAVQLSGCDYLILRTSWVYASRSNNFMLTMLKLAQEREELSIVSDQIGAPTSARLIADTTILCIQHALRKKQQGYFSSNLYHMTASGKTSWHGFTEEIVNVVDKRLNISVVIKKINAIPTSEYPTPAPRPMNSQLTLSKLEKEFNMDIPDWKKTLELCMDELAGSTS
jgi:dTDP-4-dehydrorhamnose reductase